MILGRIDLENILKSFQPPGVAPPKAAKSSGNLRTNQLNITTEELLSWAVFRGRYDDFRDLKALLRSSTGANAAVSVQTAASSPIISDEISTVSTKHLVDQFFRHVHVKIRCLTKRELDKWCTVCPLMGQHGSRALALPYLCVPLDQRQPLSTHLNHYSQGHSPQGSQNLTSQPHNVATEGNDPTASVE